MGPGEEAYAKARPTVGGLFTDYHGPSATSWGPERLDLFASADAGSVLHRYYTTVEGWSDWETITPSEPGRDPLAHVPRWWSCSWGQDRLDVFGVKNGHLEHLWYQGDAAGPGWGDFDDLGGDGLTRYLAVAAADHGRLDVMAIDEAGSIQRLSYGPGGWTAWSTVHELGRDANRLMFTANSPATGVIDLFTVTTGDRADLLGRARYSPATGWQPWERWEVVSPAAIDLNSGSLAAASDGNHMWLFAMADGGNLLYTRELDFVQQGHQPRWADWRYLASVDHGGSACRRGTTMHVAAAVNEHPANVYFTPTRIDEHDVRTEILNR